MPPSHRTWLTTTRLTPMTYWLATIRTRRLFIMLFRKITSMDSAVAFFAYRYSITYLESCFWMICPKKNMVGVDRSNCSTFLTCILVPLIDRLAPQCQGVAKSTSLPFKRLSILPSSSSLPNLMLVRTFSRTIFDSSTYSSVERGIAIWARYFSSSLRPALSRAIARRICSVLMLLILVRTNFANKCYAFSPRKSRWNKRTVMRTVEMILSTRLKNSPTGLTWFRRIFDHRSSMGKFSYTLSDRIIFRYLYATSTSARRHFHPVIISNGAT